MGERQLGLERYRLFTLGCQVCECVWFWFCRRCFIDSQLPGSKSQFLARTQDEKLHMVIDAFRFHNRDTGEVRLDSMPFSLAVQL